MSAAVERSVADEAALVLGTFGGKLHVKFDHPASVTMLGQLPFFVELLQARGLYERWIKSASLHYNSPNAASVQDVLGTLFIAALSGMRRYRHINALRADGVSPGLLGMTKIVSDDSLSRALGAMDETAAGLWRPINSIISAHRYKRRRGFSTSTRRSSPSMVTKKAPPSATTRTSPVARHTPSAYLRPTSTAI